MKQTAVKQDALANPISRWALGDRLSVSLEMIPEDARSLIDLGCGEGHFLAMIEKRFPKTSLTGVDLSDENILRASKLLSRAKLIEADASHTKFPSSSFDVVSVLEVLDHVEDDGALLLEARRLLKPKGVLIISAPDSSKLIWNLVWEIWTRTFGRRWRGRHLREYDERKLEEMLTKYGFRVKKKARALFGCIIILSCEKT